MSTGALPRLARFSAIVAPVLSLAGCFPYFVTEELPDFERSLPVEYRSPRDTAVLALRLSESIFFVRSVLPGASPGRHVFEEPLFVTAGRLGALRDSLKRNNVGLVSVGITGTSALISGTKLRELCLVYADGRIVSLAPPEYGDKTRIWREQTAGMVDAGWRNRLANEVSGRPVMTGFDRTPVRPFAACFVATADAAISWSGEERRRVVEFLMKLPAERGKAGSTGPNAK
ncbi:MAG TPA: hypothetical protein VLC55_02580 [Burkholderiales bacterium]|nr:hypothetical protein [Burkholderiales bacterium]